MSEAPEFESIEDFERWLAREQEEAAAAGQTFVAESVELTEDQRAIWRAMRPGFWV